MRPARYSGGFSLPRINSVAAKLAIALAVVSVVVQLAGLEFLKLVPAWVIGRFYLWEPLTYVLIAVGPFGVIFGTLITWSLGGALEASWGPKRFLIFAIGATALAGVLTTLLALVIPGLQGLPFSGGTVMTTGLWIAYGLSMGRAQANFWGLPMTGNGLALLGLAFVLLNGVFASFLLVIPDLFAAALAFAYVRGFSPRVLWLRFQSWRLHRQLKGRSKHLRVVDDERNVRSGSDRYLH